MLRKGVTSLIEDLQMELREPWERLTDYGKGSHVHAKVTVKRLTTLLRDVDGPTVGERFAEGVSRGLRTVLRTNRRQQG
jgi:hypothetical protein